MKVSIRFLFLLLPVLAIVVVSFSALMNVFEERWALADLNNRAQLIYDSIQDSILDSVTKGRLNALHRIYKRISNDPNLQGVVVCSRSGGMISRSPGSSKSFRCEWKISGDGSLLDKEKNSDSENDKAKVVGYDIPGLIEAAEGTFHRRIFQLSDETDRVRAYVMIFHDPGYLDQRSELTRRYTIYAFLALGFFISLITLVVHRWSVSKPVEQMGEVMKGVLTGDSSKISKALENTDFAPLVKDIDEVLFQVRQSKINQKESNSDLWDPIRLNKEIGRLFGESRICMISNDEPCIHTKKRGTIEVLKPASGIVHSMEPVARATSGVWIAHGSGTADKETVDKNSTLLYPPENPEYAVKRVWLSREEEQGYFYGFSNEGLWPLCHQAHVRPTFRQEDWEQYVSVNAKFANSFSEEMKVTRPISLIQGHHFALLPSMIRKMRPDALSGLFWHIPWPNPEAVRICPWRKDLLMGILGADLVGFQLQSHCNNFLDSVDSFLEARVSRDEFSVTIQGHTCYVKPFRIGVDWPSQFDVPAAQVAEVRAELLEELGVSEDSVVGVGVDRLDYTKGIVERFEAIERLLEKDPQLVGKFHFIQVAAPTARMHIKRYQDYLSEIQKVAERVNWRFYSAGYQPITLRLQHHSREEVFRFYRAANFCYVNSLHDGMNIVAKEFVSSRSDDDGVLILSSFTGASFELKDALVVNPYDAEEGSDALKKAIEMPEEERRRRMKKLRAHVAHENVYAWAVRFLREIHKSSEESLGEQES